MVLLLVLSLCVVCVKHKTEYEMRISDWSSDVCSSDLVCTSPDHQHWQKGAELIALDQIGWIGDDGAARHALWAPDIIAPNGRHYPYFSFGPQHPTPSRIGVATFAGFECPCTASRQPLITRGTGFQAIAPHVFFHPPRKYTNVNHRRR